MMGRDVTKFLSTSRARIAQERQPRSRFLRQPSGHWKIVGVSPQTRSRRTKWEDIEDGWQLCYSDAGTINADRRVRRSPNRFPDRWRLCDHVVSFGRETLEWHGVASIATLLMTLLIQRAEHRDTQALQAKLDELLRVNDRARTELTQLDQLQPEEIERKRAVDSASD
jgi:hypothetical protein